MNSSVDSTHPVPVAIIGMGCLFPKADGLSRYWTNIRDRVDAITEVPATHWRPEDYFNGDPKAPDQTYARRGGFLDPVDFPSLEFGIAPNNLDATDTTQLLGLMVARAALEDAGYGPSQGRTFDRDRVSVILGVTGALELVIPLGARLGHPIWRKALKEAGVDDATAETVVQGIADSYVGWQENSFPGLLGNVAAGRIANRLDLGGTNCVIDAACASSLGAVHLAVLELANRRSDMVLTGGLDTFNDIFMYMCFSKTPALSPSGDARPFDIGCDGTIIGEGLGVLALKRLDDAKRDGDRIYAVIRSVGSSSDGKGNAVYAPSAPGQMKALQQAYDLAEVSPETVELVEAHGTGTKVGDATELTALNAVYRGAKAEGTWCALGSVKSQIGHTKAAAGAAGLIKAALALHHKVLPPTAKVNSPLDGAAPGTSPFYVNTESRPWMSRTGTLRRAAVSAFGFGGSNFHCVLEEADSSKSEIDWDGDTQILAFSGNRLEELRDALDAWPSTASWSELRVEAARSRARFQPEATYRLTLVVERQADHLEAQLQKAKAAVAYRLEGHTASSNGNGRTPAQPRDGIYLESGPARGGLALLFPGQGSQYVGMLRPLACRFPQMHEALADVDATPLRDGRRLGDVIYPHPAFTDDVKSEQEQALRATEIAQPALGAVSLGLYRLLEHFGVQANAMAGHSFGELTALCAAGRFDAAAFDRLARRRGDLMAGSSTQGERGAMMAVFAPLDQVASLLRSEGIDLVVANKNAPRQAVVSGPAAEIARAASLFESRKITTRTLAVSAAFHSRFVAEARVPFLDALRDVPFAPARIPVFANTTASPYPDDPKAARELLGGQLAHPVEFVAQIEAMFASGIRTFLEVGPDGKLTGLVDAILEGKEHASLTTDGSRGRQGNLHDLACALARLAALGHAVALTRWDDGIDPKPTEAKKPTLTVKVSGANFAPKPKPKSPQPPAAKVETKPAASPQATPAVSPATATPPRISPSPTPAPKVYPQNGDWTAHHGRNGTHPGQPMKPTNGTPAPAPAVPRDSARTPLTQPIPSLRSSDPSLMAQALHDAQANLVALQKMGEQTSQLHRQYLEGQDKAQRNFQSLLEQQQRLTLASLGLGDLAPPAPIARQAPVSIPTRSEYSPRLAEPAHAPEPRVPEVVPASPRFQPPTPPMPEARREAPKPVAPARPEPVPVPAPAPAPVPPQAAVPQQAQASSRVHNVLIEVVADKTGYPPEMLEPDMQLDADLGIDSIKRVEILSAIQERLPDAPVVKPEHLGTLRTLGQIVDFLAQNQNHVAIPGATHTPAATVAAVDSASIAHINNVLIEVVADKTGYPPEMLEPDMQLDADLGIDSIKRVEILSAIQERLPDAPVVKPEHLGTLRTLGQIVDFLAQNQNHVAIPGATPAPAATVAAVDSASIAQHVNDVLIEVVADKTGYPPEMLEPDMQLDADLGIDSIKRVEILSAIQERLPDAQVVKPEHLGTLRTLGQIVEFLTGSSNTSLGNQPVLAGTPAPKAPESLNGHSASKTPLDRAPAPTSSSRPAVQRLVVKSVALADSGSSEAIALRRGGEIWITDDGQGLAKALAGRLESHGYRPRLISRAQVGALTPPSHLDGLILLDGGATDSDALIGDSFRLLRTCGTSLRQAGQGGGALLATVSRLDGHFGFRGLADSVDPTVGGLAGMAKTAGHEWPEVACKAIDLDPQLRDPAQAAERLYAELFRRGPAEVGLTREGRTTLELTPVALPSRASASPLQKGDVVVVTGGARGVTAEVALALAEASQPTVVLLGRSPEPTPEPTWLAPLVQEGEIKRALAARANGHATPQIIGAQFRDLTANREILANLERIRATGAHAIYRSVDVRDGQAVRQTLNAIRTEVGPIRGLVHGAGVLADRLIVDQSDDQFASVYDTKVHGLRGLLDATAGDDLRVLVLFSSSTARFGRKGQVAYAAANEILNKWAQRETRNRPHCRVVSVNWGPWAGGMVTPSLRPLFESEGVPLIPLRDGARYLVEELSVQDDRPTEIVILGGEGITPGPKPEIESPERTATNPTLTTVFERTLDVASTPILRSHIIDGRPVLPMALILEWLAQGALQRHPGLAFSGIDDLRLFKGVVLRDDRPETIRVLAAKAVRDGAFYRVPVELRGKVEGSDRDTLHARAEVLLAERLQAGRRTIEERDLPPLASGTAEIYRNILFHGPDLQGIDQVEGCDESGIVALAATTPAPATWMNRPLRQSWLSDPLSIDCAFQMLIVWSVEHLGAASLPTFIGRYRQFRNLFPQTEVRIVAKITQTGSHRARADVEILDLDGGLIAQMSDYECVIDASLNQAFRRNRMTLAS